MRFLKRHGWPIAVIAAIAGILFFLDGRLTTGEWVVTTAVLIIGVAILARVEAILRVLAKTGSREQREEAEWEMKDLWMEK